MAYAMADLFPNNNPRPNPNPSPNPHQVLTLRDEGMPVHGVPSEFGSLRVELVFNLPSKLSAQEREFLRDPAHLAGATDAADIPDQPSVF